MFHRPLAGAMFHRPLAGAMFHRPLAGAMFHRPLAGAMFHRPLAAETGARDAETAGAADAGIATATTAAIAAGPTRAPTAAVATNRRTELRRAETWVMEWVLLVCPADGGPRDPMVAHPGVRGNSSCSELGAREPAQVEMGERRDG